MKTIFKRMICIPQVRPHRHHVLFAVQDTLPVLRKVDIVALMYRDAEKQPILPIKIVYQNTSLTVHFR